MDYINYVKQSPMMGQIGLGGGATSLGRYGSGGYNTTGVNNGARGLFIGGYDSYQNQKHQLKRFLFAIYAYLLLICFSNNYCLLFFTHNSWFYF